MYISRRRFVRNIYQLGKAGLFYVAGGSLLFKGCAEEEPVEIKEFENKTQQKVIEDFKPGYKKLEEKGEFSRRIEQACEIMEKCILCPRRCKVNRRKGEKGFCNTGEKAIVYSYQPHFGEEVPLVGNNGSGTIFFSNCNLRCVFCQNWPIAHEGKGSEVSDEELANMMLDLQDRGCHNVNLVTPTHVMPNILNATRIAMKNGLKIPLCYNTSGYENTEQIKMLDSIIDIYLPDLKFMEGEKAERYNEAEARNYPELAREAIAKMHQQVGQLAVDERGIAKKGLIIRHLVMPNGVAGTEKFVHWVSENLSPDTYVNIMAQYRVEHKAFEYELISRAINPEEFVEAIEWAVQAGLTNIDNRALTQYNRHLRKLND